MAPPADLREWVVLLEREGVLVRVSAEADPDLEITEIVDRAVKAGPALLFENPKGSSHPLLINQFGTEGRMVPRVRVERLDDVAAKARGQSEGRFWMLETIRECGGLRAGVLTPKSAVFRQSSLMLV